jgi:hypothetical protein
VGTPEEILHVELTDPYARSPTKLTQADIERERLEMRRFAAATGLPPISRDEVRIVISWADFGQTEVGVSMRAYVVRPNSVRECELKYGATLEAPLSGRCRPPKARRHSAAGAGTATLARWDGRALNCGWIDGAWMTIEGDHDGAHFVLTANNPEMCSDEGSKAVIRYVSELDRRSGVQH